ncbi:hypothetical protein BCV70DRAFT_67764 [Testicularia cyperi]|uniref:ABC transporter domain-containing protein n=1 Tax=Testicularia cyperi TaxID=1882483 RepID=A0A317XGZ4_9BASI|nr:hypothetical protein BCV70DRAFT_67764 [Testicularia cyperi]
MSVSSLSAYETCPPGLTTANGTACNTATCNSPFVSPSSRTAKPSGATACSCDDGFGGVNCNVCQSAGACQARRTALGYPTTNSPFGGNDTLVCHRQPSAVRTTYIDCDVKQLTVNGVYPGEMRMTLSKTGEVDDFVTTGLASWAAQKNTALSQVWLNGVEQFYCQAAGCSAQNSTTMQNPNADSKLGSSTWTCTSLQCYCIPGTAMCGGGHLDLTSVINNLNGTLSMPCDYVDPTNASATASCAFKGELLNNFLGAAGLPLENCEFGSCITQNELDTFYATGSGESSSTTSGSKLSGSVIAGLVILGLALLAICLFFLAGVMLRNRARRRPVGPGQGPLGLQWHSIDYSIGTTRFALPGNKSKYASISTKQQTLPELESHIAPAAAAAAANKSQRIIRNSSGRVEPGSMVAILGPSGAGKTSLVEILAGRDKIGSIEGSISRIEAADVFGQDGASSSRRLVGFVDQDDALPAYSTVKEALSMAAKLSLPENVTSDEKTQIVSRVLHQLGLESVANKRIGDANRRGLSGGERRRVSIGCALVARPRLLIADEPLSGLDAYSASQVTMAFRELAAGADVGSTTVLVTVHQPSSDIFYSFDKIILMSSGAILYEGSPAESLPWCQRQGEACPIGHNVADHLLKIASLSSRSSHAADGASQHGSPSGEKSNDHSPSSPTSRAGGDAGGSGSLGPASSSAVAAGTAWARSLGNGNTITTFMTQFGVLLKRAFLTAKRDPSGALAHNIGAAVIGLIVGGCFYQVKLTIAGFQNRVGSMYFLFILLSFSALSAATSLAKARPLMMRERANALYGPSAWLVSYVLYDAALLRVIPAVILTVIEYWMVGLKPSAAYFFEFLLISVLFHIAMALYNMILSALIQDLSVAILFAGVFILFNIGFGGFLLNLNELPAVFRWLQWICPMKYALEAVASHELDGLQLVDNVGGVNVTASVSIFSGNLFAFKDGAYYRDLLVLALGFVLGFFVVLNLAVRWRMRERR